MSSVKYPISKKIKLEEMKRVNRFLLTLLVSFNLFYLVRSQVSQVDLFTVDQSYIRKHDIVYQTPAYEGYEGFPIGNGDLGGMVWNHKNGFEIQINKNDLFDQPNQEARTTLRGGVRLSIDLGVPAFEWLYLDEFEGRLSLQNADVTINSETPFLNCSMNSWVSADKNVWIVKLKTQSKDSSSTGTRMGIGLERWGSRAFPGWYGGYSKDTKQGLGDTHAFIQGTDILIEEQLNGMDFTVAARMIGAEVQAQKINSNRVELNTSSNRNHEIIVMIAVVTSRESETPTLSAIKLLDQTEMETPAKNQETHHQWWKEFWSRSFVHLSDDYIENIYYLRRYLMASSSRGRYPVVFNGGLWTWNHDVRNWVTPHHWNTQQQYWGLAAQNDCNLMLPYLNTYFRLMPQAEAHANLRGAENAILWSEPHDFFGSMTFWDRGDMINNFTPACQIAGFFWEYFQFTGDRQFLVEKCYPFMQKAAEFYVQTLQWDKAKNEYFLFPSQPYESPRSNNLKNSITDRNMILATLNACIEAARILNSDAEKIKKWQHIIDHIWNIPYRIEPGVGEVMQLAYNQDGSIYPLPEDYGSWTNHFSANTSLVFPANLIGLEDKSSREFKAASNVVVHHAPEKNAISPDPIVAARLGLGDVVLDRMKNGIRRLQHFPQGLFYNIDHWYNLSLYMDSVKRPDITTQRDYIYDARTQYPLGHPAKPFIQCGLEPLSIYGAAVNEMLLQSNEGKIRIFPAVPTGWSPAFKLRARGAFMVSAEMNKKGSVRRVQVESLKGNDCKIVNPWGQSMVEIWRLGENQKRIKAELSDRGNTITFETLPNTTYMIFAKGTDLSQDPTLFKSEPNQAPKYFFEASLGKKRNF